MTPAQLHWWEREKLLTEKDKQAIQKAIHSHYADIDESDAETEAGRYELHAIIMRKYHNEEFMAGLL